MSTFEDGLNTFVNAKAPNPCCRVHENLGPFELIGEDDALVEGIRGVAPGVHTMVTGFRRCSVCQKRHFLSRAKPESGQYTTTGTPTEETS